VLQSEWLDESSSFLFYTVNSNKKVKLIIQKVHEKFRKFKEQAPVATINIGMHNLLDVMPIK